jgi:parvulin-like peptidyl-prolyl isomerase
MEPGSISDPIRTRVGYNILKLVEVNEPRQFTFDEVKDKIGNNLRSKKREAIYSEWMAGLKAKYPVKRF